MSSCRSSVFASRAASCALATLAVLGPRGAPAARAGNQNGFFLGNMASLSGGAVAVVGDDGASLWYNPAGLVVSRRDRIDLSGSAYTLRLRDYPGVLRGDLPDLSDEDDPRLDLSSTELLSVPSAIAFVRHLSDDVSLGFGLFVPLLDRYSARSELEMAQDGGTMQASVELGAESTAYAATVGLGWRATPCLRLGATLALYYQTIDIAQTLLFGYEAPPGADASRGNGAVVQEDAIDRFGMNVFLGAQWQVSRAWALGAVVRTPLIQIHESLERRRFQLGADVTSDGDATVVTAFEPLRKSGFDTAVFLNFSFTLGLAWTPADDTFLALELDLQPGSNDDGLVRDFVWNARLGGIVPLSDTFRIGAGLFTDLSWEPDPDAAWVDQVDFYGVATGIYFETPIALANNPDADSLVFTSTFGLRYALGVGTTVRAVADPTGVHTDPSRAEVDLTFHELGVHIGSGLKF